MHWGPEFSRRLAGIAEHAPLGELIPAALTHGVAKLAVEIGEITEGARLAPLLAHEQERRMRSEQQDRRQRIQSRARGESRKPLAEGPVSDLVMVLQEVDEAL